MKYDETGRLMLAWQTAQTSADWLAWKELDYVLTYEIGFWDPLDPFWDWVEVDYI